jgi:hypothetical protein
MKRLACREKSITSKLCSWQTNRNRALSNCTLRKDSEENLPFPTGGKGFVVVHDQAFRDFLEVNNQDIRLRAASG